MASTRLLDLPPEIRNTIYHLVLCEYRINLTRGDIPCGQPSALTVHGKPLALQAVCKTLRKETSEIVPSPIVSISDCLNSDIRTIRVPQFYLNRTRRLVIDLYVACDTDLSWFVTSMPHLLEVEIHLPMTYVRVTDIDYPFVGPPVVLDVRECAYGVKNIPEGTQVCLQLGRLFADLETVQDKWLKVIDQWSTEPSIVVRRAGVYYDCLGEDRPPKPYQRNQECICVTVR